MRVERTMAATPQAVFACIERSVLADMAQSGHASKASGLKSGDRYTKTLRTKLGAPRSVTVCIHAFEPPSLYEASFKSSEGTNIVRYEIAPCPQGSLVAYEERFQTPSTLGSLNQKLMQGLLARSSKKRMRAQLDALEAQLTSSQRS